MLEKARKEFDAITKGFNRTRDSALANEEMNLWEDRTCEALVDFGALEAATKVRNAKGTTIAGEFEENMERRIDAKETVLVALLNDLSNHPEFWKRKLQDRSVAVEAENGPSPADASPPEETKIAAPGGRVEVICTRLHLVARQLRDRHERRSTLQIEDEYDVQDLLHSLLRIDFDDVRTEEWTPSYAGGSARMDFLLKAERIVVEAKMARHGREAKKISEELIVDAARYRGHPDCRILVCLVHDPDGVIRNPRGVETDLRKLSDSGLQVIAIIAP